MIEVKNLTKYYGDHKAVDHISFSIQDGTVCGFLGPNGAGKSTTMNIMTGCLSATEGTVSICGFDIFDNPIEAKRMIGYLPEQPPLYFEETPREYLRFVAEAKKIPRSMIADEIERSMQETQISDVADRLIKNLSKGYKQRVGIAQTLLGNPKVIILDEPTVGLDPIQVVEIRDLIKSLGQKHTVILSSHILSEVQNMCDEILIISKGRLVAYNTAENLEKMLIPKATIEIITDADEEESTGVLSQIAGIERVEFSEENYQEENYQEENYQEENYQEENYQEEDRKLLHILIETSPEQELAIRKVLSLRFAGIRRAVLKIVTVKANLVERFIVLTNTVEKMRDEKTADEGAADEGAADERTAEMITDNRETETGEEEMTK